MGAAIQEHFQCTVTVDWDFNFLLRLQHERLAHFNSLNPPHTHRQNKEISIVWLNNGPLSKSQTLPFSHPRPAFEVKHAINNFTSGIESFLWTIINMEPEDQMSLSVDSWEQVQVKEMARSQKECCRNATAAQTKKLSFSDCTSLQGNFLNLICLFLGQRCDKKAGDDSILNLTV